MNATGPTAPAKGRTATWAGLGLAGAGLLALAVVAGLGGDALFPPPPAAAPPAARAAVDPRFLEQRCRLLDHHQRQLSAEAAQIADEELAPIFAAMRQRSGAFADWAFRWRTSYSLLRRMTLGGAEATLSGGDPFDRLRVERDAMVAEAFQSLLVVDADAELTAAAGRWRDRLSAAVDGVERDHRAALQMYLGFDPPLGIVQPPLGLPETEQATGATSAARDLITTRLVRPVLVRGTIRTGAVFLPPAALLPEVVASGALLPGTAESVAALLGVDYLVSRLDAWVNRDSFAAEIETAVSGFQAEIRTHWVGLARRDVARRLDVWRDALGGMAGGQGGCPPAAANRAPPPR